MRVLLAILLALSLSSTAFGADKQVESVDELFGVWQAVELKPDSSTDQLAIENIYFAFLPSMVVLEVVAPIDTSLQPKTESNRFTFENSTVIISKSDGRKSEHEVSINGNRLKFIVPFGEILLEKASNHSLKGTK